MAENTKLELVEEFLQLIKLKELQEEKMREVADRFSATFKQSVGESSFALMMHDELKKAFDALLEYSDFDALYNQVRDIYAKNLTEEELQAAIAFHKTPAGKSWFDKQNVIAKDIEAVSEDFFSKVAQEIKLKEDLIKRPDNVDKHNLN